MTGSALSRPELRGLVDALAGRFSAGDVPVRISVGGLTPGTLRAVADLLGADRLPRSSIRVDRLLGALRLTTVDELRAAVEAVTGPLADRRAERAADAQAKEELWAWLAAEAASLGLAAGERGLAEWCAAVRRLGVRGGLAEHRRRLEAVVSVLRALPADAVPLAGLAADHAGGPHELDPGRLVARMVLDAISVVTGLPKAVDAESARSLWESVGVVPDPLSSTVLALGLAGSADDPLGSWLSAAAAASEPVVITLASLRRWPLPPLPTDAVVFVVENPSLLVFAAAERWVGPPLVCSAGRPTIAVVTLLRQLGATGATLHQHADFDPSGLAISSWLRDRTGTVPWRMASTDYVAALPRIAERMQFDGPVPPTPWDAQLSEAMRRERLPVYEEDLRADLLNELRHTSPSTSVGDRLSASRPAVILDT